LRGWKSAYAGLGLAVLLIGLPSVALLVRDAPGAREAGMAERLAAGRTPQPYGYPLRDCLRMRQFWTLLLLFTFVGGSLNAVAVHLVALVEDRGSAAQTAVLAASLFGGAMMAGRLVTGYLMDRFFAPAVAAIFFLGALVGMALLMSDAAEPWLLLASVLVGLCAGAEGDVLGFLISRYFGLRSMGKVYGYIFSAYLIGVSVCPWLMGLGYELTSSYTLALATAMVLLLGSTVLVLRLGAYPVFPAHLASD
jgi:MFS family permease